LILSSTHSCGENTKEDAHADPDVMFDKTPLQTGTQIEGLKASLVRTDICQNRNYVWRNAYTNWHSNRGFLRKPA